MMNKFLPTLGGVLLCIISFSQDRSQYLFAKELTAIECGILVVDLGNGTVNGLNPVSSAEQIKSKLPCFSGFSTEKSPENCNGGVFYKSRDIYFYTSLDCINIRSKFTGTFLYNNHDLQLFGLGLSQLKLIFGRDYDFYKLDATNKHRYPVFQTAYGLLVFHLLKDHVVEINICNQKRSDLRICD